jgi:hypothetical protein
MHFPGRAGVTGAQESAARFARSSEPTIGNNLPAWLGSGSGPPSRPGPGPAAGGQVGRFDGASGSDPARPDREPFPPSSWVGASGESDRGDLSGPPMQPIDYSGGMPRTGGPGSDGGSNAARLGRYFGDPHAYGRHADWRGGIQGFNDRLQIRDRHAYYDSGSQRTGISRSVPGNPPNYHSDGPARPDLRLVNRSVNPQIGSDATANQDDLARPYTWLGQQDGTTSPVYGGLPGLWVPYGTRGGIPYPIQAPVAEGAAADGPAMVWSGPPHGLHSDTLVSGAQIMARYNATPQMRPVRFDRPSNSPIAGQSYSQTVQMQGAAAGGGEPRKPPGAGLSFHVNGRGWLGG